MSSSNSVYGDAQSSRIGARRVLGADVARERPPGGYYKDGTQLAQQESRAQVAKGETWKQKRANMRASVSMRVRVCACVCVCAVRVRVRSRAA